MIVELLLISEILRGRLGSTPPNTVQTKQTRAKTHTKGSGASLAGNLGFGGQITNITMPLTIKDYTDLDAARDYQAAVEQYSTQPESIADKLRGGRL
jgi:hypothetical protein